MNPPASADPAEGHPKHVGIDQIFAAVPCIACICFGVGALWRYSLRSPHGWGMILLAVYLASNSFGKRRLEMGSRTAERLRAAIQSFWNVAVVCVALPLGIWCDSIGEGDWGLLSMALLFCTSVFGPTLIVRWYRWQLKS